MKIIKNEKLIKRNNKIGGYVSILAIIVLGVGMYISIKRIDLIVYAYTALILGFVLMQIGMYMGNRYGRSPRPDEKLDTGLKGLPGDFTMYHYTTPTSHLLIGPAGVWVILPYHQRGLAAYQKNRWRINGGGFLQAYMRIFGQEGIGRPDLDSDHEIQSLKKVFAKNMEENEIPEINTALVFTNDEVEVNSEGSPIPAMKIKQLKDFMRQRAKEKPLSATSLQAIKTLFEE